VLEYAVGMIHSLSHVVGAWTRGTAVFRVRMWSCDLDPSSETLGEEVVISDDCLEGRPEKI
jgi:hypothetical protein